MRILICGSTYIDALHGQAIFTRNLAEGLAQRGNEVVLLLPNHPGMRLEQKPLPFRVICVPSVRLKLVHPDLSMPVGYDWTIQRQLDHFRPEIVHAQDCSPFCQAVILAARRRGIPVMATHHVGEEVCAPYLSSSHAIIKKPAEWLTWKFFLQHLTRADLVSVPSHASADNLVRHGLRSPVRRVPCAVRLEEFHPDPLLDRAQVRARYGLSNDDTLVLYVGRVDFEKKVDILVRALAYLDRPEVKLVIAGQGAQEAHVRRLAVQAGVSERVIFLGQVAHEALPQILNSIDIFAMPGDGESFSIATLEALACGRPVLAAKSSALPELVSQDRTGYLFHPRDPQDAARGIASLIDQKEHWGEMASAGVQKAQTFNQEAVMGAYEQAYREAIRLSAQRREQEARSTHSIHFPIPQEFWFRSWQRPIILFLIGLVVLAGSLVFTNQATQAAPAIRFSAIKSEEFMNNLREIVLTPHPDDETLGVTGSIHGEIEKDGDVRIDIIIRGEDPRSAPIITRSYLLSNRQRQQKPVD